MQFSIPVGVQMILDRLEQAGWEAYLVGGCVRDSLLGKTPQDWDMATSARPEQLLACFGDTVAIPTGIISAGFVEQYTKLKSLADYSDETNIRFISLAVGEKHPWENMMVRDLPLPPGMILAVINRNKKPIVPKGDVKIQKGDHLIFGAEGYQNEAGITLKEFRLWDHHPWVGRPISDLNISRQTLIVMIRRKGDIIIPSGSLVLNADDEVILYTKRDVRDSIAISV